MGYPLKFIKKHLTPRNKVRKTPTATRKMVYIQLPIKGDVVMDNVVTQIWTTVQRCSNTDDDFVKEHKNSHYFIPVEHSGNGSKS